MDSRGDFGDDVNDSMLCLLVELRPTSPLKIRAANNEKMHNVSLKLPCRCRTSIGGGDFG